MITLNHIRKTILLLSIFMFSLSSFSQNRDAQWTVGLSGSLINFGNGGVSTLGERFTFQVPRISVTKYVKYGLSIDLSTTISTIDRVEGFYANGFNYYSIDGAIRYDFGLSNENLVPYVGLGMGWIGAPGSLPNANGTPTTNFSAGTTFWFSPHFGLNTEVIYKYSRDDYESMISHTQMTAGLVYSFTPRRLIRRLWHLRR